MEKVDKVSDGDTFIQCITKNGFELSFKPVGRMKSVY